MDWTLQIIRILILVAAILVLRAILRKKTGPWRPPRGVWGPPAPPKGATSNALDRSAPSRPTAPQAPKLPQQTTLDLDASQFAPLSDAQVRAGAASAGNLFTNPFFGRRDLIPPADDPRTSLIDRAMVAHGLITPDELVEIHQLGQDMDTVRPDMAQASHVAQRAVAEDKEARKRLKEQKKAEAAERKRKHAEDVAHRKATDIIYLGRGVSKGLADRRANVEKLQSLGLPVLVKPSDVATALSLTIPRLRWLAFHSDASTVSHYIPFTIPKKSGGVRQISAPHEDLATAQEWILTNILEKVPTHDAAHGFVPGRSTVTNATPHVGRSVVLNADLRDFFPSITFWRVEGVFKELGYSPAAATILALLCTESPRRVVEYAGKKLHVASGPRSLPQGACTSPALSNLVSRRMDSRLRGIATKLGWTYTRYADDLTFSSSGDCEAANKLIGYLLARVRHIASDEGFAVNESKTRVLRKNSAQTVSGIIVNDKLSVSREVVRRLRSILHHARTEGLAAQNRQNLPNFEAWVRGWVAYVRMVEPQRGQRLAEQLAALNER